jgi:hypothetical protein
VHLRTLLELGEIGTQPSHCLPMHMACVFGLLVGDSLMSTSLPILILDGEEYECGSTICTILPTGAMHEATYYLKPPWLMCVEIAGMWSELTQCDG